MCQLSDCTELYLYDQQLQLATFARIPKKTTLLSPSQEPKQREADWFQAAEEVAGGFGMASERTSVRQWGVNPILAGAYRGAGREAPGVGDLAMCSKCLWALRCGNKLGTSPQKIGD